MNLFDYHLIIINSSSGKDSLCAISEICDMASKQGYPLEDIHVSHQDLGRSEWEGTKELAKKQADHFGLQFHFSKRKTSGDIGYVKGYEESLLEYVLRRGKWPSNKQRYCTSDFKRGPGARVVTELSKEIIPELKRREIDRCKVLYVFGFRKDESPSRSKKKVLSVNKKLTTKKRLVHEYLPIHKWSSKKVWWTIKASNLPYHWAYDLGMPRLSCVFCIFSPFDALVIAGYNNPELLDEYIEVEKKINHTFQNGFAISEVKEAIKRGYKPKKIVDWIM